MAAADVLETARHLCREKVQDGDAGIAHRHRPVLWELADAHMCDERRWQMMVAVEGEVVQVLH